MTLKIYTADGICELSKFLIIVCAKKNNATSIGSALNPTFALSIHSTAEPVGRVSGEYELPKDCAADRAVLGH